MTFYQELQLNQAGSKALIRSCTDKKEKMRHTAILSFKNFYYNGFLHGCSNWVQQNFWQ